ncbi:MAG: PspC domain-containing protein [Anaerolineales bacterium]|nr:PspC domain-containing protein [Anaerolineales bacterium]
MTAKRLYRSRENRMLGGVAAGLGDFLDIDPTIVRLLFAFAFIFWGVGVLVYVVMWIVVPEEPDVDATPARKPRTRKTS